MINQSENSTEKPSFFPFIVLLILVAVTWGSAGYWLHDYPERGTFGDMFGAVNALFSGLAFAGIIYTILLQRRELELQREELRATRTELARSASAQEKSEQALQAQVEAAEYGQRLAAINHMLEFSQQSYTRLLKGPMDEKEIEICQTWAERRFDLIAELDRVYAEVVARRRSVRPIEATYTRL